MTRLLVVLLLLFSLTTQAQVLWFEDFEAETDGVQTGTAAGTIGGGWTATYAGAGTFSKQSPAGNLFQVTDTDTQGEWRMNAPISIAGTGRAIIETTVVGFIVGAGDFISCYYRVDGGPEILYFEQTGAIVSFTLTGSAIVTGSTLEIIIRASTDGSFFGIDSFTFDDIRITGINTLYSRKSGNWTDVTVGNSTWSAIALGGTSCNCAPIPTDYVIIGNTNVVDISASATAGGLEIRNTGSLRYTAATVEMNIDRGILQVDLGGSINRNGQTSAQIDFDRGVISSFINNGTITTGWIDVTAPLTMVNISGNGSIALLQDFNILADDIIIDNNLNGTFTIGEDLIFDQADDAGTDDAEFINRRTLSITGNIVAGSAQDDGNGVTNMAGATLNFAGVNANDAAFDILNSGTITQTGDFVNIVAQCNFDNLAAATWNWNFVQAAFDAQMVNALDCSAAGNTFVYGAAGNQSIIAISYQNLTGSNSGIKSTTANLDINGNLLIAGTARLDPNAGNDNITLAGNWTVTSTNADPFDQGTTEIVTLDGTANTQTISTVLAGGETFTNLVINNTFASPPQLTLASNVTVSTVLTMTSGRVNLNTHTFTISANGAASLVHNLTATNGWMYNGTFTRATAGTAFGVGTARGLYPVGSPTNFRPVNIGKPTGTTAANTSVVHDYTLSTTTNVSIADDVTILKRHDSFWTVVTACTGGTNTWTLRAGGTGFGTVANITHLRLPTPAGVVGTPGTNSGTVTDFLVERLNLSIANLNANRFHIGSIDGVNSPLPIELTRFDAVEDQGRVQLNWTTASELNNDFFTIERTIDAEHFEEVIRVPGKGTVATTSHYEAFDNSPSIGTSYYRLKQTDFDGQVTYSDLRRVLVNEVPKITVYPNPSTGAEVLVQVIGLTAGEEMQLLMLDVTGRPVYSRMRTADASGNHNETINATPYVPGFYLVQIKSSSLQRVIRLLLQ